MNPKDTSELKQRRGASHHWRDRSLETGRRRAEHDGRVRQTSFLHDHCVTHFGRSWAIHYFSGAELPACSMINSPSLCALQTEQRQILVPLRRQAQGTASGWGLGTAGTQWLAQNKRTFFLNRAARLSGREPGYNKLPFKEREGVARSLVCSTAAWMKLRLWALTQRPFPQPQCLGNVWLAGLI